MIYQSFAEEQKKLDESAIRVNTNPSIGFTSNPNKSSNPSLSYDDYTEATVRLLMKFSSALKEEYPSILGTKAHGVLFSKSWFDARELGFRGIEEIYVESLNLYIDIFEANMEESPATDAVKDSCGIEG